MISKRGKDSYCYKSVRVNGTPKSIYVGKPSSPKARQHERDKKEKAARKNRAQELAQLHEAVDHAMHALHLMKRGYLVLAGYYERKSEIRKLKEEVLCTMLNSCNSKV